MLTLILSALGTLIPTILNNSGVIGTNTTNLLTGLVSPIENLFTNLKSGTSKVGDGLAALAAIQATITVLEATTGLPATVLTEIQDVSKDVSAALAAYAVAGQGYSAPLYNQIAEV